MQGNTSCHAWAKHLINNLLTLPMWRRQWHPIPVLLPGKSHGWRSLVGCSPWCREESDTKERLHFHFSLSCIGEGNGNPLQCSCQENPRDGGAWWAAVSGVSQGWTRLKQLSSSSHSSNLASETIACILSHLKMRKVKFLKLYDQRINFCSKLAVLFKDFFPSPFLFPSAPRSLLLFLSLSQ